VHMPKVTMVTDVGRETSKPHWLEFFFYAQKPFPAATMRVAAIAKYRSTESHIKFASVALRLPLALNCRLQSTPQSQRTAYKITLDTDKEAAKRSARCPRFRRPTLNYVLG
jgi:hypothetical protein